jgi:hypothetical protein
MTTDNFCFYLQNRLIQTSQTGGQWYGDTSPFSIPWFYHSAVVANLLFLNLKSPSFNTTKLLFFTSMNRVFYHLAAGFSH